MKDIVLSVEDAVYEAACQVAQQRNTTLEQMVREALKTMSQGLTATRAARAVELEHRLQLADLLEKCQIDLTERPTRENTYARDRFH